MVFWLVRRKEVSFTVRVSRVSRVKRLRLGLGSLIFAGLILVIGLALDFPTCSEWNYMPDFRRVDTAY